MITTPQVITGVTR